MSTKKKRKKKKLKFKQSVEKKKVAVIEKVTPLLNKSLK